MNSSKLNATDNYTDTSYGLVTVSSVFKCLPMILIGIVAFVGNSLVLVVVYRFKSLQTFSNLYIGSLAITDVLASFVMPLSYTTVLLNGHWVFGEHLCNIQGFATTLLGNASMLTLLCFSIYRCYLITTVRKRLSVLTVGRVVKVSVGMIWLLAFIYALPPLFGGGYVGYLPEYYSCLLDFSSSMGYTTFLIVCVFILPLLVMLITYVRILHFIRLHNHALTANTPAGRDRAPSDTNTPSCCPSEDDNRMTVMELKRKLEKYNEPSTSDNQRTHVGHDASKVPNEKHHLESISENPQETIEMTPLDSGKPFTLHSDNISDKRKSYSPNETKILENTTKTPQGNSSVQERLKTISINVVVEKWRTRTRNRQKILKQYRKRITHQTRLARILFVTVALFVICWAPFAVDSLFKGLGNTKKRPKGFELVSIWLAYTNAICNPVIYALLNSRFKKAFGTILKDFAVFICICKR